MLKILKFIFPKAVMASPGLFFTSNLFGLSTGLFIGIKTTLMASFFNAVAHIGTQGDQVLFWGIMLAALTLADEVSNGLLNYFYDCVNRKTTAGFMTSLHEKAGRLSPIVFERPEFLDRVNKASKGAEEATRFVSNVTGLFTTYIPYVLYMGIYLYGTDKILVFALLLLFLPVMLNQFIRGKIYADAEDRAARERRKRDYYRSCIFDMEYVKETRLLGKTYFFRNKFEDSLKKLLNMEQEADRNASLWKEAMAVITLLGYGEVLALLVSSLLRGEIEVGSFAAIFSSVGMMYGILEELVEGQLGAIAGNFGAVRNYVEFFAYPEKHQEGGKEEPHGCLECSLELKNVSFSYPDSSKMILKDINLSVKKGETIAIVGENGAGKSTLMKVMMGLYEPSDGTVLVEGTDTGKRGSYGSISAVFQRFQRYHMTGEDNLVIGDYDKERDIRGVMEQAGLSFQNEKLFPEGKDTMLSREFGGRELSGGQWQRLAIARAIYRERGILFLDEPTAAIDPLEESELYRHFERMCQGKTAVIVTHRMGCARIANRIVVLEKGKIVQLGTHEELYQEGGCYKRYWDVQAADYCG